MPACTSKQGICGGRPGGDRKYHGLLRLVMAAAGAWTLAALAAGTARAVDPCTLLDKGDAAAILGEPVGDGRVKTVSGFAGGLSCAYFTAAPLAERGGTGSVQLVIHDAATMKDGIYDDPGKFYEKMFETSRKSRPGTIVEVDGVGEKAYWQSAGDRLHVLAGGTYFILEIKDLVTFSAGTREELERIVSAHRLEKSREAALGDILPKLSTVGK